MSGPRPEGAWLDEIRSAVARGDAAGARRLLDQALTEYPRSYELRRSRAGIDQQSGRVDEAERQLAELLAEAPGDAGAAFALARLRADQDRSAGAAATLRACFGAGANAADPDLAIQAIEFLNDLDRQRDAAAIAEAAVAATPADARLHAYAGMLAIQLGDFARARERYLFAIAHDPRAYEWHAPIGLSHTVRYRSRAHPDIALFQQGLARTGLSTLAQAELHFALAKAADDCGDYGLAAAELRNGNALRRPASRWSRKAWRRAIEARLAAAPLPANPVADPAFAPIFIVGMPRSGTTLLAELLSRFPQVRNRGELPTLAGLAADLLVAGPPSPSAVASAAAVYARRARRDDAPDARWFIDKQPVNFRYVDLALALFPDARILHCQRNPRDVALSLWMQCFLENVQDYAYDFAGIATVLRDEARLMAHWRERWPDSILPVRYEELVQKPDDVIRMAARWIGLPEATDRPTALPESSDAIDTASVWQARQPVNTRSIARWRNYAAFIPELLRIPEA